MCKILIVEDDFDTLFPLAEMLRLKGHIAVTASNAEQALRTARDSHPDIIITDIVLPGKSGLHFISTVRREAELAAIPIMVISGCGPMVLVEAELSGANICLDKPINIELFWRALDELLRRRSTPVAREDPDTRTSAAEIDLLVERLRDCNSAQEKEAMLKTLKERILENQVRKSCA